MGNFAVSLKRLVEKVSLEVIYTPCDLDKISVEIAEVNRPGLFLAGYYDYFDKLRLQIMGLAEMNFLAGLTPEKRRERLDQLFRQQPPAVILCRNEELEPFPEMQELAKQHGVALLRSNETTCTMMGSLISVLNLELAPASPATACWWKFTVKASSFSATAASARASWPSSWSSAVTASSPTMPWSCARSPTVRSWVLRRKTSATSLSCAASASSTWPACSVWARSR